MENSNSDPPTNSKIEDPTQKLASWGRLHPFCLPQPLLDNLTPRRRPLGPHHISHPSSGVQELEQTQEDNHENEKFGCLVCQATFEDPLAQRAHFKTDWHRYNVKRGRRTAPLKQDEFLAILDALEDSLSGSEDEEDSSSEDEDSNSSEIEDNLISSQPSQVQNSPLIWFTAPAILGDEVQLGMYRCILSRCFNPKPDMDMKDEDDRTGRDVLSELTEFQRKPTLGLTSSNKVVEVSDEPTSRTWTMLMVSGGHFAGMIVSTTPELRHIGKGKAPEKEVSILEHKTFHRYTTRRKQGGGQAAHDTGGKGMAKSAGANLRRYNEQALAEEIRALLSSWSESIATSELVFIRASKQNSKIFFNYDKSIIRRDDPRIRSFPFPTRRPTLNELKRCYHELTRVQVTRFTQEELDAADQLYVASLVTRKPPLIKPQSVQPKKTATPKPQVDPTEQRLNDRWERLIDMVQKGRLSAVQDFLAKHTEVTDPDWTGRLPQFLIDRTHVASVLHLAAMADQVEMVEWLLVERRCDPTTSVQTEDTGPRTLGMTPYELAGARSTRNVFRRAMANHPDWYDWMKEARVPSGLTEELEAQQLAKGKDRKQRLKDKLRERDKQRDEAEAREREEKDRNDKLRAEEEIRRKAEIAKLGKRGPQRLGAPAAAVSRPVESLGLNADQRMRLERERRARAAEARMKT